MPWSVLGVQSTCRGSQWGENFTVCVQQRIALINGQRFAYLMLKHGVGVRVRAIYTIQTVDEDQVS